MNNTAASNEALSRFIAKGKKSLAHDKIESVERFAVAVDQEGEGQHDLANFNYYLAFGGETTTDFRSSSLF